VESGASAGRVGRVCGGRLAQSIREGDGATEVRHPVAMLTPTDLRAVPGLAIDGWRVGDDVCRPGLTWMQTLTELIPGWRPAD
ncbi:MAG: hypothetical protein AAF449_01505, partial [Myxococcota bacterium]